MKPTLSLTRINWKQSVSTVKTLSIPKSNRSALKRHLEMKHKTGLIKFQDRVAHENVMSSVHCTHLNGDEWMGELCRWKEKKEGFCWMRLLSSPAAVIGKKNNSLVGCICWDHVLCVKCGPPIMLFNYQSCNYVQMNKDWAHWQTWTRHLCAVQTRAGNSADSSS